MRHRAAHAKLEHYLASLSMLEHYLASLSMPEQITPTHPLVHQLRFELEILRALPPRPDLIVGQTQRRSGSA